MEITVYFRLLRTIYIPWDIFLAECLSSVPSLWLKITCFGPKMWVKLEFSRIYEYMSSIKRGFEPLFAGTLSTFKMTWRKTNKSWWKNVNIEQLHGGERYKAAAAAINSDAEVDVISNNANNTIDTKNNYKDALLASLYTQVDSLKSQIEEKDLIIRSLLVNENVMYGKRRNLSDNASVRSEKSENTSRGTNSDIRSDLVTEINVSKYSGDHGELEGESEGDEEEDVIIRIKFVGNFFTLLLFSCHRFGVKLNSLSFKAVSSLCFCSRTSLNCLPSLSFLLCLLAQSDGKKTEEE